MIPTGLKHTEGRIPKADVIIEASVSQSRDLFSFSIGVSPVADSGKAGRAPPERYSMQCSILSRISLLFER